MFKNTTKFNITFLHVFFFCFILNLVFSLGICLFKKKKLTIHLIDRTRREKDKPMTHVDRMKEYYKNSIEIHMYMYM